MDWREIEKHSAPRIAVVAEETGTALISRALTAGASIVDPDLKLLEVDCKAEDFAACIAHLSACGFIGVAIGNPFKSEAARLAKEFFIARHALGVANALKLGREIYAQNTEALAFSNIIRDIKPGLALLMGSGRAARSAAISLFEHDWRVKVWNRSVLRSRPFAVAFNTVAKVELASQPDPAGCSLIVNATPLGAKAGEQPPVKWTTVGPRAIAIDFVYRGVATEFLRSAAHRGLRTIDGRELLVEQAALALEWWLGKPADRRLMLDAIGFHPPSA